MDPLRVDIMGLTFKVKADRIVHRIERESGMGRLEEKLRLAGEVVARATAAIEAKADEVIAREETLTKRSEEAFSGHHAMLDDAMRGLDALERQLATVTNDPLQSSGDSQDPPPLPTAGHPVMKNIHTNNR